MSMTWRERARRAIFLVVGGVAGVFMATAWVYMVDDAVTARVPENTAPSPLTYLVMFALMVGTLYAIKNSDKWFRRAQ